MRRLRGAAFPAAAAATPPAGRKGGPQRAHAGLGWHACGRRWGVALRRGMQAGRRRLQSIREPGSCTALYRRWSCTAASPPWGPGWSSRRSSCACCRVRRCLTCPAAVVAAPAALAALCHLTHGLRLGLLRRHWWLPPRCTCRQGQSARRESTVHPVMRPAVRPAVQVMWRGPSRATSSTPSTASSTRGATGGTSTSPHIRSARPLVGFRSGCLPACQPADWWQWQRRRRGTGCSCGSGLLHRP